MSSDIAKPVETPKGVQSKRKLTINVRPFLMDALDALAAELGIPTDEFLENQLLLAAMVPGGVRLQLNIAKPEPPVFGVDELPLGPSGNAEV